MACWTLGGHATVALPNAVSSPAFKSLENFSLASISTVDQVSNCFVRVAAKASTFSSKWAKSAGFSMGVVARDLNLRTSGTFWPFSMTLGERLLSGARWLSPEGDDLAENE